MHPIALIVFGLLITLLHGCANTPSQNNTQVHRYTLEPTPVINDVEYLSLESTTTRTPAAARIKLKAGDECAPATALIIVKDDDGYLDHWKMHTAFDKYTQIELTLKYIQSIEERHQYQLTLNGQPLVFSTHHPIKKIISRSKNFTITKH